MPSQFDREKTKKNIDLILKKVKTEVDPQALNSYRSLFKKEVSFFSRSWVAAYLLMLYDQGALGRSDRNRSGRFGAQQGPRERSGEDRVPREGRAGQERSAPQEKQYPLAEEDSRRLFLSIGRNRRVFPREILGLINTKTAIPREDIGAIRILDNYSFVQVRTTVADTIIEALNGQMFRGRVLVVNYARARKEEGENRPADFDETDSDRSSFSDTGAEDTALRGDSSSEETYNDSLDLSDAENHSDEETGSQDQPQDTSDQDPADHDFSDQEEDQDTSDQNEDHSDKEDV
jgi:hypothetical protein